MALTSDQITAKDFKEFYDRILPYLNGAGGNDYSTTEKVIGSWIDGSPLYQKTFTGLSIDSHWDSQSAVVTGDIRSSFPGIDFTKVISAVCHRMDTNVGAISVAIPLVPTIYPNNNNVVNFEYVAYGFGTNGVLSQVTLQYTK